MKENYLKTIETIKRYVQLFAHSANSQTDSNFNVCKNVDASVNSRSLCAYIFADKDSIMCVLARVTLALLLEEFL